MSENISVAIIGATGYSGMELVGLLARHPRVALGPLFANSTVGRRVDEVIPKMWGRHDGAIERYEPAALAGVDLVFIALPSGEAMGMVPGILERGVRAIDLGGDFRLGDAKSYRAFYGREHSAPELLPAAYGLPELGREAIHGQQLLANPGCYPTSAILPLAPLLSRGLIERTGIVITSMSGASGAGRSASAELSFCEVNESVRAYRVGTHQHLPEIRNALERAAGADVELTFTPHLIPITRGIHTSIHARLREGVAAGEVDAALRERYAREPFVRLLGDAPPDVKNVVGTNRADIGWYVHPESRCVQLFCTIDNLLKGAAGQALQNMNILYGFDESEGLP